ncbi:MAG: 50S ribosomal protein L30 [Halobacteriaceae archaeon]
MKAVVQLRGAANVGAETRDTLEMLNLHHVNHCTLVPDTPAYRGMVTKVNDVVAHGEPSAGVVETLLRRRAEPAEGEADTDGAATAASPKRASGPVDDEWVADNTDYDGVGALAEALCAEETTLQDAGLAPVLRLHPPRGGHRGIKTPRSDGGQLGAHATEEIDELLEAMR